MARSSTPESAMVSAPPRPKASQWPAITAIVVSAPALLMELLKANDPLLSIGLGLAGLVIGLCGLFDRSRRGILGIVGVVVPAIAIALCKHQ